MARALHKDTGLKQLCLAGGVALNSVANGRILRETPFEELYIQPAAGDGGGALGAALYAYHCVLGQPRNSFVMEHAYWGRSTPTAKSATSCSAAASATRTSTTRTSCSTRGRGHRLRQRGRLVPGPLRVGPARARQAAASSPIRAAPT